MKLYGIEINYYFNEVDGKRIVVLKELFKNPPDNQLVSEKVESWFNRSKEKFENGELIFSIDKKSIESRILDFECQQHLP